MALIPQEDLVSDFSLCQAIFFSMSSDFLSMVSDFFSMSSDFFIYVKRFLFMSFHEDNFTIELPKRIVFEHVPIFCIYLFLAPPH